MISLRHSLDWAPRLPASVRKNYAAAASFDFNRFNDHSSTIYKYKVQCRSFHLNERLFEHTSSKVEATVNTIKIKQKEKEEEMIKKEGAPGMIGPALPTQLADDKAIVVKKPLKVRIWEEVLHYYHGFRLLFVDINVCRKLLWRVLSGKTLTRRENKLLLRTTSDLFRLVPFAVFIIVPFMELLLPVFIKFFPGMLPSTFQTAKDREEKLKQSLQVRLEVAKFLQKTLDEMSVQHKEHQSEDAKQFDEFFQKIKNPNAYVSNEDMIKYAKRFEDEITLDSLSREQLVALCRVLEVNTMGTTNFLRFHLRMKLRQLAADDRAIAREGVNALDLFELQQACKTRGMRAYGLSVERLRSQLQEWIELSLNEKVPPTLLLLSRALFVSVDTPTTDKLKETIRVLPDTVAAQTMAAIGEREGKIDNKTKIEVIKEEVRKIKEEREEERQVEKAKVEELVDKAPIIEPTPMVSYESVATPKGAAAASVTSDASNTVETPPAENISSKDVELLSEALSKLSNEKKQMSVEKETIKDLKEEMQDYKEDIEQLREVRTEVHEPVRESRAAKMLFKKVNNMIDKLDKVLVDLETKQKAQQEGLPNETEAEHTTDQEKAMRASEASNTEKAIGKKEDVVRIDELVSTIKQFKETSTESRLKTIEGVLEKLDGDKDGVITVDEVLKVIKAIGHDNVHLDEKQVDELITLLDKEEILEAEDRIEKAIARSMKETNQIKEALKMEEMQKQTRRPEEELKDIAPELKDNAMDLDEVDKKNAEAKLKCPPKQHILEASEKQKDSISPKASAISSTISPTIPPTANPAPVKDKMLWLENSEDVKRNNSDSKLEAERIINCMQHYQQQQQPHLNNEKYEGVASGDNSDSKNKNNNTNNDNIRDEPKG